MPKAKLEEANRRRTQRFGGTSTSIFTERCGNDKTVKSQRRGVGKGGTRGGVRVRTCPWVLVIKSEGVIYIYIH